MNNEGSTIHLILKHASRLFADRGYEATGTREIAESCGIEQTELFHHFSSKEEIMNTLLKADLDVAVAAAERQLESSGSPAVRLYRYLVIDLETACRSPFNLAGVTRPRIRRELSFAGARARHQRLFDARVNLITQGIRSREFVACDPVEAGRAVEWTIEGLLTDLASAPVADIDATVRDVTDMCMRGLLADPGDLDGIRVAALESLGT